MTDSDILQGIRRTGGEPKRDPGREAPPDQRRGMNIIERYELAKQQARERGKNEPSFQEYAEDTFAGATSKPKELEQ